MLVMSILRMVGAARPRMSFGTGVWVIFSNWSLLRSSSAASDAVRGEDGMKRYLTFGNQRKYRSLRKERVKCRYTISIAQIGGNVETAVRAGTVEAFSSDTVTGLRLPASAALSLASCWPRPQQLLPVSAAGARVAFAAFLRPLGRGLEKQKAAPASPPFICRWQRSAPLQSSPLPQKVRVLSAKAGENGMPFGKFAKERSNCL